MDRRDVHPLQDLGNARQSTLVTSPGCSRQASFFAVVVVERLRANQPALR